MLCFNRLLIAKLLPIHAERQTQSDLLGLAAVEKNERISRPKQTTHESQN